MVLAKVVAQVSTPWFPTHIELALLDAVLEPVEAHVHGFGMALLDGVIGYTVSTGIVGLEGSASGWLGVA